MKQKIRQRVDMAVADLVREGVLPVTPLPRYKVERCADKKQGDFYTNAALTLSSKANMSAVSLASLLKEKLDECEQNPAAA